MPHVSTTVRLLLAALAGGLTGLAFEPWGWGLVLPLGVAGWTLAIRGGSLRTGFAAGTAYGVVLMLVLLPWLQVIGPDAWVGLSVLEGLLYGLGGALTVAVCRAPAWPLGVAAAWVGLELVRGTVPFGGFPWGRLAFATIDTPYAATAGWVGAAGTGFLVALTGALLAAVVAAGTPRRRALGSRRRGALAGLALLGVTLMLVALAPPAARLTHGTGAGFRVAAVQGDVPGEGMNPFSERRVVLENHVAATTALGRRVAAGRLARPDVVVWPENSSDIDPFADPTVFRDIQGAVDAVDAPTLVGVLVDGAEPEDVLNQGILWRPSGDDRPGPGKRYSKQHPVPFGEYIPLRDLLAPYVTRLDQIPRDMVSGRRPGVFDVGGARLGDVICFEVAYDEVVRSALTSSTDALVVQTNNATYMGSGQVAQQFAISRLRAVETGRPVVVAATNGITGVVAADGTVREQSPVRTRDVVLADLADRDGLTPGVRLGRWLEVGLALAGLGLAALGMLGTPGTGRDRRGGGEQP